LTYYSFTQLFPLKPPPPQVQDNNEKNNNVVAHAAEEWNRENKTQEQQ